MFEPNRGSRENAKKVLIVITDGESNDGLNLPAALKAAKDKGIVRFAVGVSFRMSVYNGRAKSKV